MKEFLAPSTTAGQAANILVHVPRTGGTYFNSCLRANGVAPIDHVERFLLPQDGSKRKPFPSAFPTAWISGHVRLDDLKNAFPSEDGYRYFVLLRNPYRQLISQINWQAESFLGNRFSLARMPNYQFRLMMRTCIEGVYRPDGLPSLLNRYFGYFLNNQSRSLSLLTGGRRAVADLSAFSEKAFSALTALDGFSLEAGLDHFVDAALIQTLGPSYKRTLVSTRARNSAAPFIGASLTEQSDFMAQLVDLQLPDFVTYLNAKHILSGGSEPVRWATLEQLKERCIAISNGSKAQDSVQTSITVRKVRSRLNSSLAFGRVAAKRNLRQSLPGMGFMLSSMPPGLRQLFEGRRSLFRKLAALKALAKFVPQSVS